jgi:hypothetical protein
MTSYAAGSALDELLRTWQRRAVDREESARSFGETTMEGRVMSASAAETRVCIAELEQAVRR